jgi:TRAP-type mannitol/chloroaromatic compound transport system permease small subunit
VGFPLTSNGVIEAQWYLFSLVFLLGASYSLRRNEHVRVDVFYSRFSPRLRAWLDLLGTLLFLVPFAIAMIVFTWPGVARSFAVLEVSPDPGGLPRYPIKAMVPVAFVLLILQAFSELVKSLAAIRGDDSKYGTSRDPLGEGRIDGP